MSLSPRIHHRVCWIATLACLAFALAKPAKAYNQNHPLGIASDGSYQGAGIDNVNLFSGTLSLNVPLGPFGLTYSSNVWKYKPVIEDGEVRFEATPDRMRLGGLGWHLSWGEVFAPGHLLNDTGRWLLASPDGSRHVFYDTLHKGEDDGEHRVLYTRDGTYLRMVRQPGGFVVDIESPNGGTSRYTNATGAHGSTYRLERTWSAFASAADPDATVTYNQFFTQWTMTDRYGRSRRIFVNYQFPWLRVVTRVETTGFGGTTRTFRFEYDTTSIAVSCKADSSASPDFITVPLLTAVVQPDGTRFEMKDAAGNPAYHTTCDRGIADVSGALTELSLPTGGRLSWTYQEYEFPPGGTNSVFNTSAGVATRTLKRKNGGVEGVWRYRTSNFGAGPSGLPADDPKVITEVVYPTGECSKHFFNARYYQSPAAGRGWEYGLPFDYSESSGGRYLSVQNWAASTPAGACDLTSEKLRSSYISFRHDLTPGSGNTPASEWYDTNRQPNGTRVVFHDDGNRWIETASSDFDGLGHFRVVETRGTLRSASATQELHRTTTNFNKVAGTYLAPGYEPPAPDEPWVLGIHDSILALESDAFGQDRSRIELGFEPDTGFLMCTRERKSSFSRRPHDVVTVRFRNALGQLTDVKRYGGDLQTLSGTGAGCGDVSGQPETWTRHGYAFGARAWTRPIQPNGTLGAFLTYDADIDAASGQVARVRDPNGIGTTLVYDSANRLSEQIPDGGPKLNYSYVVASPTTTAKAIVESRDPLTNAVFDRSETWLDDFGRVWRERKRLPGGAWSERERLYNARGWLISVSEVGNLSKRTQFMDFDAFGRPRTIRPPDGADHDVLISYVGVRQRSTSTKVAQVGGESYVTRSEEFDSYGRVRRVQEPSGPGGSLVPTLLDYDVGSRVTRSRQGTSPVQTRLFVYDGRGNLISETHPETGAVGNGSITYSLHDTRGTAHRRTDGLAVLSFSNDFLGRPTEVREKSAGDRRLVLLEYDQAPGTGLGKLWRTTRDQWVDVPWLPGIGSDLAQVTETFEYRGLGGAVSSKKLRATVGGETINLGSSYTWNTRGQLSRIGYSGGSVDYAYDQGFLTEVTGWATLAYHPSGALREVTHSNQVKDLITVDPNFTTRVGSLSVSSPQINPPIGTGQMSYDGAGNVEGIGVWSFAYDGVNRLVDSDFVDVPQQFRWDAFGNMTAKTTTFSGGIPQTINIPVSGATNRLQSAGADYDGAGNLTRWGSVTHRWSAEGHLTSTSSGGQTWSHLYTAAGERIGTLLPVSTRPEIRWTARDLGQRVISEFDQVGVIGQPGVSFASKRYYWAGPRLIASDGTAGERHYHPDHLGSVRVATDAGGQIVFGITYLPFGESADPPDASEDLQFTGHERDHATGLDYMHARYYTQDHGRFLSVDPVRGSVGRPQSLNRYAYVEGNPLGFIDPDGRDSEPAIGIFVPHPPVSSLPLDVLNSPYSGSIIRAATSADLFGHVERNRQANQLAAGLAASLNSMGVVGLVGATPAATTAAVNVAANPRFVAGAGASLARDLVEDRSFSAGRATLVGLSSATGGLLEGYARSTFTIGVALLVPAISSPTEETNETPTDPIEGYVYSEETTTLATDGTVPASQPLQADCNAQGCLISGERAAVEALVSRLYRDARAIGGLNSLISGSCSLNPLLCTTGGGAPRVVSIQSF